MIKGVILDIDGVIIGEKRGFNFPAPHKDVLQRLRQIREKGIPIALCTAKPNYSIRDVIDAAHLNNPHITDAGAVIIDPINNMIVQKNTLDKTLAKEVLNICFANNIYVEFYTTENYFIQKNQLCEITEKHKPILQRNPIIVDSLTDRLTIEDAVRIMPIAKNEEDKKRVSVLLEPFKNKLSISWGLHPSALPLQFGIITALGSSKKEGAIAIMKDLNISFNEILGIGDTTGDWSFIQLCGYGATLENGTREIKELVQSKGKGKFYIGKSVDENGILDIFNFFSL